MEHEKYNPVQDAAGRDGLTVSDGKLPAGVQARYLRRGKKRAIVLDEGLAGTQVRAALTHELVHDERGVLPPGVASRLMAAEEATVRRLTTDRLVPPDNLEAFLESRATIGGVTAEDVANEFHVPRRVAVAALRRLSQLDGY